MFPQFIEVTFVVQFEFQYTPKVPTVSMAETLEIRILGRRDQTVRVDRSRARKMANCNHLFCNNPPSLSLSNTIGVAINLRIVNIRFRICTPSLCWFFLSGARIAL